MYLENKLLSIGLYHRFCSSLVLSVNFQGLWPTKHGERNRSKKQMTKSNPKLTPKHWFLQQHSELKEKRKHSKKRKSK